MFTEDKDTEIFCMADDFCKFYDASSGYRCLRISYFYSIIWKFGNKIVILQRI